MEKTVLELHMRGFRVTVLYAALLDTLRQQLPCSAFTFKKVSRKVQPRRRKQAVTRLTQSQIGNVRNKLIFTLLVTRETSRNPWTTSGHLCLWENSFVVPAVALEMQVLTIHWILNVNQSNTMCGTAAGALWLPLKFVNMLLSHAKQATKLAWLLGIR